MDVTLLLAGSERMIWPIFWITVMVGLVLATAIAALREKSTRTKAIKSMASQTPASLPADSEGFDGAAGFDGNAEFGTDGVDAFGTDQAEFEAFDENAFK